MSGRLAPAGLPLGAADVAAAARGSRDPGAARDRLIRALEEIYPGRSARLLSSGRAALTLLFEACRRLRPERDIVAMGAYTCWSVPAAAVRAGLRVLPVDIDPEDLDFREEALRRVEGGRVLALVTHHLFGHPNRRARSESAARAWGAFLIDDAAQGFGAEEKGSPAGGAGEGGILSFGRGKAIPALGGGALLAEKGSDLDRAVRAPGGGGRGVLRPCRAALQGIFLRPSLYGIPASIPALGIGETVYDASFPSGPLDGATASLAERLLRGRKAREEARRRRAAFYREEAAGLGLPLRFPQAPGLSSAIRCPAYAPAEKRDGAFRAARDLGVSAAYPAPVHRIPGIDPDRLAPCEEPVGAERIAREILTLPTHPLVDDRRAREILRRIGEAIR